MSFNLSKDKKNKFLETDEHQIDILIDEIENKQTKQLEIINVKEKEIKALLEENQKMMLKIQEQKKEIKNLNNIIDEMKHEFLIKEKKIINEAKIKIEETCKIMEIKTKIDIQNKEIEKLEKITEEQVKQINKKNMF